MNKLLTTLLLLVLTLAVSAQQTSKPRVLISTDIGGTDPDDNQSLAHYYEGDYWEKFWLKQEQPAADQKLLPVACILTMAGTGSEMNAGTVITDAERRRMDACSSRLCAGFRFDGLLSPCDGKWSA